MLLLSGLSARGLTVSSGLGNFLIGVWGEQGVLESVWRQDSCTPAQVCALVSGRGPAQYRKGVYSPFPSFLEKQDWSKETRSSGETQLNLFWAADRGAPAAQLCRPPDLPSAVPHAHPELPEDSGTDLPAELKPVG